MYLLALVGGTGVLYYSAQYAMPMPLPHQVQRLDHENTGSPQSAAHLTSDLVDGLGEALDVAAGDASDGDSAVLGGVDGVLRELVNGLR